jgi:hypothetical protein
LFCQVVAPDWAWLDSDGVEPTIGGQVRVIGRYVGCENTPTVTGGEQDLPLLLASTVIEAQAHDVEAALHLPTASDIPQYWSSDDAIFTAINDYPSNPRKAHLERRPYYYLLGRIQHETINDQFPTTAPLIDGVSKGLWEKPEDHRGEVVEVIGTVMQAWIDDQVGRDRPYGIERVGRLLLWRVVFGVGDRPFRDLYEIAVPLAANQALPVVGEEVQCIGRFLKVQMYHNPRSRLQAMVDPSLPTNDQVLCKLFVTPKVVVLPPVADADFTWLKIAFLVLSGSFGLMMIVLIRRDSAHADDYKRQMRQLRSGRRRVAQAAVTGEAEAEAEAEADDATGSSDSASQSEDSAGQPT